MKILKTLGAGLLLLISTVSIASEQAADKRSLNESLSIYIEALAHGKVDEVESIFDKDFKYTISRADRIYNHQKSEYLSLLKSNRGIRQNCEVTYTIVEATPNQSVVKVSMKYDGFTNVSYVNLADTKTGWKITNVCSSIV